VLLTGLLLSARPATLRLIRTTWQDSLQANHIAVSLL